MSDKENSEEPSMEDILASIRKIISDDDEVKPAEEEVEAASEPEPEAEPEPEPEPEPKPEPEEEDVLELTEDDLEEDVSQDDIDNMFDNDEPEDELVMEDEPEEEPEPEPEQEDTELEEVPEDDTTILAIDDVDPAKDSEALISEEVSTGIMGEFDALSALLTTGYSGSGNTLEDLVRELLKPMLKAWLEDNLPALAERMVAKEIARLARTKKP